MLDAIAVLPRREPSRGPLTGSTRRRARWMIS
jgi:hypothetical protein